jgi:hypothetical protein
MQIKLQKLDQGWQAEATVNGQIYQWACWGYSRAEARAQAVKVFAEAVRRDADEAAAAATRRAAIIATARQTACARTQEAAL